MDNKTVYYSPLPPKPASLLIIERGKGIRVQELNGDMKIGRDAPGYDNDIKLSSKIVGRSHGSLIYDGAENCYYYKDNNSLNGTFFNGVKLQQLNDRGSVAVKLNEGDILRIDRPQLNRPHDESIEMIFSTRFSSDDVWKSFSLQDKEQITIGRSESDDLCLKDFMASRTHAVLTNYQGTWVITDNNSKNGLAVCGQIVQGWRYINLFDVITIANSTLIVLEDSIVYFEPDSQVPEQQRVAPFNSYDSVVMQINLQSVSVRTNAGFGRKTLLRDINLNINAGDFILILGGSGAGKTTFLRAILGDIKADGVIAYRNMDFYKNFKMLKHKLGIVPQFSTTRDNDSVIHTITDAAKCKLAGDYSDAEILYRVNYIIEKMRLSSLKNNVISTLSGGQKKRVEVAIQAIGDQEVFILDEPDSGMDFASRVDLMENLKSCTENGGIVSVITHSPDDAAEFFTKVIVLAKSQRDEVGRLAYYGDVPNALEFFGVEKLSQIVMEINYEGGKGRADEFIEKFAATRNG